MFWLGSTAELTFKEFEYIQTAKFGGAFAGFLVTLLILMQQHKNITQPSAVLALTGTIYDEKSGVLKGAKIFIEGDNRSTISDDNGYFALKIDPNLTEWRLIASYDGQNEHKTVSKNELNKPVSIQLKKKQ